MTEEEFYKQFYEETKKRQESWWLTHAKEINTLDMDETSLPPALFEEEDGECGQECVLDDILSKASELDTLYQKIEDMKVELQGFLTVFYESCPRAAELFDEINRTYKVLNKKMREMNKIKIDKHE